MRIGKRLLDEQVGPGFAILPRLQVFLGSLDFKRQFVVFCQCHTLGPVLVYNRMARCLALGILEGISRVPLDEVPSGLLSWNIEVQGIHIRFIGVGKRTHHGKAMVKTGIRHQLYHRLLGTYREGCHCSHHPSIQRKQLDSHIASIHLFNMMTRKRFPEQAVPHPM